MKLTYLKGIKAGESLQFRPPGVFIGREEDNDLQLVEDGVSQYHAKILFDNGKWALYDLNSSNGTKLNGEMIKKPAALESKDVIHFANAAFRFEDEPEDKKVAPVKLDDDKNDAIRIRSPEESKPAPKSEENNTKDEPQIEKKIGDSPVRTKKNAADAATMRRLVNEAIRVKKKRLRITMLIAAVVINLIILATAMWIKYNKEILDMLRSSE